MIAGFAPFLLLVSRSRNWHSDRMYHILLIGIGILLIAVGGMPGIHERKQG